LVLLNATAPTPTSTLSLHDALPIYTGGAVRKNRLLRYLRRSGHRSPTVEATQGLTDPPTLVKGFSRPTQTPQPTTTAQLRPQPDPNPAKPRPQPGRSPTTHPTQPNATPLRTLDRGVADDR